MAGTLYSENGEIEWRGEQSLLGEHHQWRLSVQHKSQHKKYLEDAANDPVNCDLRYQGQVFDSETGLYYNRHRYYDPETCQYLSPDPIGMAGGLRPQAYVHNPMEWVDPLGLVPLNQKGFSVYGLYDKGAADPYYVGISNDPNRRLNEHIKSGRFDEDLGQQRVLQRDLRYDEARGYEQTYIEKNNTKNGIIGEPISSSNRGNKYNSFDKTRTDPRGEAFKKQYEQSSGKTSKSSNKCG